MPGQRWLDVAASFLGMWIPMMVAMMLPSLIPMLQRYRQSVVRTRETHLGALTALVGIGYFFVWTVLVVFMGVRGTRYSSTMWDARCGGVVVDRGVSVSAWKAHHLLLRETLDAAAGWADAGTAGDRAASDSLQLCCG